MSPPFRQRIFAWLVIVSVVPAVFAIVVALVSRGMEAPVGGAGAWERAGETWRAARAGIDTTVLDSAARAAIARHEGELRSSWRFAMQAQDLRTRFGTIIATIVITLVVLVGGGAILLAGHLSRQMSRPIDELVDWTARLQHGEALPIEPPARGAPEFELLRRAFRAAEIELTRSRRRDVQAAELRAFRDMARQVAHELKNPLTPIRMAIGRLADGVSPEKKEMVEIIAAESARLERMARDFGDLGRLPEGPMATIDLAELFQELLRTVPPDVSAQLDADPGATIQGHYEMLRRAFANLVLNALDAVRDQPVKVLSVGIKHAVRQDRTGLDVTLLDTGPGFPPGQESQIFEPYFTTKKGGTGLGLAIVRQAIHHHGGIITAERGGGGALFRIFLPKAAA